MWFELKLVLSFGKLSILEWQPWPMIGGQSRQSSVSVIRVARLKFIQTTFFVSRSPTRMCRIMNSVCFIHVHLPMMEQYSHVMLDQLSLIISSQTKLTYGLRIVGFSYILHFSFSELTIGRRWLWRIDQKAIWWTTTKLGTRARACTGKRLDAIFDWAFRTWCKSWHN